MSIVEQEYQCRMEALSSSERVARSMAMLRWNREILARQIVSELGAMSEERLRWEVALRMYGSNSTCRILIQRRLASVSC